MKIPQAAKELNRHPRTVKRWIQSGLIKAVKIGRDWEVPESEIIRLKGGKLCESCLKCTEDVEDVL